MIIRANDKTINVNAVYSDTIRKSGKSYPALRIVLDGEVTADALNALYFGEIEILDDDGNVSGVHTGYTTLGEHSVVLGKVTTAEQERDELSVALAAEQAKLPYIETLTANLDDATASTVIPLYGGMAYDGALIKAGTRINWKGVLKRAAADLWDTETNDPEHAPNLWEDILYRDGYRIIPEVITVGLAFSRGEKGWWGEVLYESAADNNVYTPAAWADNWKEVQM